ncbi:helix-turn-helix domain-containing protein [Streptococcus salivarius]
MFTDRLTKLRQARGWTKKEFSVQIGKTQQTVGKWENGTNAPTFKDLVKLVELFGVTSDYLLGLSDSPSKYAYPPFNDDKEEYVGEMFKQLDEGNQDATVDFIENRLDHQHISKEIKENGHRKQIVKQDQRPTKRVSIYAKVDAQGFELSEVPVDCLDYPVPIPVHDIAFKVVGESLEPSFFDDEVIFVIKDSILRTGDISIVQLNSRYYVMKVSQNRENGDILLNSLNSNEAPITLSEKDDFSIFGKIVLM